MTTQRESAAYRAASLDALELVSELKRCASVAARHLSYSERDEAIEECTSALMWRESSERLEVEFLACVDEVRRRAAQDGANSRHELESALKLYGAHELAGVEPPAADPSRIVIDGLEWTVVETTRDSAIVTNHVDGVQVVAFRLLCERSIA